MNELIEERKAKLQKIRTEGWSYPNRFRRDSLAEEIHQRYGALSEDDLQERLPKASIAGRIRLKRIMGKAAFVTLQDMSDKLQIYIRKDAIGDVAYNEFLTYDLGDIVGVSGTVFRTKTGELSLKAEKIELLTKAIRPLPDKFHGLADQELRYRLRYVDLMVNERSREIFYLRSKIVSALRLFFESRGFLEVETPMMHPIPGGATARPFITHHNALDMPLYLRIAPELYLKRLVVGGFEKVFELNRNFRNEGLSTRHNPEFTMLEFYEAYQDYRYLMNMTETLLREIATQTLQSTLISYQGHSIDLGKPFQRLTIVEALLAYHEHYTYADLHDESFLKEELLKLKIPLTGLESLPELQLLLFEETTEAKLIEPTFIIDYPEEVSPLARRSDDRPSITERFELYIAGRELANGFSELNDPEDQARRFLEQANLKGDLAMHYDADYIRALEYGLPPTAGEGIGIDRLVMLLADAPSIREVILFPLLRPEEEQEMP
jgi:lysyl-tRNA synthetase class 2